MNNVGCNFDVDLQLLNYIYNTKLIVICTKFYLPRAKSIGLIEEISEVYENPAVDNISTYKHQTMNQEHVSKIT